MPTQTLTTLLGSMSLPYTLPEIEFANNSSAMGIHLEERAGTPDPKNGF
jgi:hypothetical protein